MPRAPRIVALTVALVLSGLGPGALVVAADRASVSATVGGDTVNINTAGVKELMTLHGIGRKVAEKIVAYRDAHGPFKKPEEVRKVEGVGAGLWEKNRGRIAVK
jgi:competence protein ComEA